ncbi:hypothetical protein ACHAXS_012605 [Conticribra weissflogii]
MPEKERRVPCPARGMPPTHNAATACLTLKAHIKHGDDLTCSDLDCQKLGVKFRYCAHCKVPVSKRNFGRRHSHRKSISSEDFEVSSAVYTPNYAGKQKKDANCLTRHSVRVKGPSSNPLLPTTTRYVGGNDKGTGEELYESTMFSSAEFDRRESAFSASSMLMTSMTSFTSIFDDDDEKEADHHKGKLSRNQSIASIDSVELMRVLGDTDDDEVSGALESIHSSLFDGSFSNSNLMNFTHCVSCNASDVTGTDTRGPPFVVQQPMNHFLQNKNCEAEDSCKHFESSKETINVSRGLNLCHMFPGFDCSRGKHKQRSQHDSFRNILHGFRKKSHCNVENDTLPESIDLFASQQPTLSLEMEAHRNIDLQPANRYFDQLPDYDDDKSMESTDESIVYVFDSTDTDTRFVNFHKPNIFQSQAQHPQQHNQQRTNQQVNNFLPTANNIFGKGNYFESAMLAMDQATIKNANTTISNISTYDGCICKGEGMANTHVISRSQLSPHFFNNIPPIGNTID